MHGTIFIGLNITPKPKNFCFVMISYMGVIAVGIHLYGSYLLLQSYILYFFAFCKNYVFAILLGINVAIFTAFSVYFPFFGFDIEVW